MTEICQTCGGFGEAYYNRNYGMEGHDDWTLDPCPACQGRGHSAKPLVGTPLTESIIDTAIAEAVAKFDQEKAQ